MTKLSEKQKEVIDGNELIAQFMGYVQEETVDEGWLMWKRSKEDAISFRTLTFDRNWSELMPVVEKIESVGHRTILGGGDHWGNYMNIMYSKPGGQQLHFGDDTKALGQGSTKIEAAYTAVIQFIKWYNSQSLPPPQ